MSVPLRPGRKLDWRGLIKSSKKRADSAKKDFSDKFKDRDAAEFTKRLVVY